MLENRRTGPWRRVVALAATMTALAIVGGGTAMVARRWWPPAKPWHARPQTPPGLASRTPGGTPQASPGAAPTSAFAVGVRRLALSRTADRPLPTLVWYPAQGYPSGEARTDAPVAAGRFPLVLFSHGLPSLPETYAGLAGRLAAAGFVVAAPMYPHTNRYAWQPTMADVPNQPADGYFVIDAVLRLDDRPGDPLAGHLDTSRYAAAGHSAGAFTTTGMIATQHDPRLAAVVIIAGGTMTPFAGPPCEALFVHGDADTTMSYVAGREAYNLFPGSKAFLTLHGGDHGGYLTPGHPWFDPVVGTMTDFLRAALYGDRNARERLPSDGSSTGTSFEQRAG